jgi:DNA-binding NtrC family response regulator
MVLGGETPWPLQGSLLMPEDHNISHATGSEPVILVMDTDPVATQATCALLEAEGYRCLSRTGDPVEAVDQLRQDGVDIGALVLGGPATARGQILKELSSSHPEVVSIIITSFGTVEEAVVAVQLGASDYLIRPVTPSQFKASIERAMTRSRLLSRPDVERPGDYGAMVGGDPRMHHVFEVARAVAPAPTTVLMTGESGTGKSMIARIIHEQSPRSDAPFVEISCGSIPETLLESELFGHVKGAFTGAHADKVGKFEAACGGTIFLDEINSAPPSMQMKLLRVLQERVVEPVGSNEPVSVDARIVLATNQPLEELVAQGQFRQDLYYRIKVVDISLPPLRERIQDIMPLAEYFLGHKAELLGRRIAGIDHAAVSRLQDYHWPGNVRELENTIERALVLAKGAVIGLEDLPPHLLEKGMSSTMRKGATPADVLPFDSHGLTLREALETPERQIILEALESNAWNRQETAASLDINRTT